MRERRARQPGELAFSLALLAFSLFATWVAWGISGFESLSSAGVFPMLATFTMVVTGLFIVSEAARALPDKDASAFRRFTAEVTPLRLIVFALLIGAYMLALEPAGFLLSSFLFLFLALSFLYRRGVLVNLLISGGSLAVIYIIFRQVFSVVLPSGWLF